MKIKRAGCKDPGAVATNARDTFYGIAMKPGCIFARTGTAIVALALAGAAQAQGCSATSGPQRVALVELYTSEGCSSCPPADKQLSLIGAPANTNVVALALHVNFWDYIGWKDPFARAEFTERQRWLIGVNGGRTLYTPHFFVGGVEISDRSQVGSAIRAGSVKPAAAKLNINAVQKADGGLDIRVNAAEAPATAPLALYAAVTESALVTQVKAGENRGSTLPHDHVVRHWFKPVDIRAGHAELAQAIALTPEQAKKGVNLVAFVQNTRTGEVLQALSTGACRPA
jgi:hypothetical protein